MYQQNTALFYVEVVCFFCLQSHAWVIEKNWTLSNKRCFFECDDCQCFSESCGPCATFFKMAVFRKDPCGFTCVIMTYAAVIYADYVVVRWNVFAFYYKKLILEVLLSCSNYKLIIANFKLKTFGQTLLHFSKQGQVIMN